MSDQAMYYATEIYRAAKPVLRIVGLGGRSWCRNVPPSDARRGPWLQARYTILDQRTWDETGPCLYMVAGDDQYIRYFGISRNGLRHRWRLAPALDAETMAPLPEKQLFHSQCWKHLQAESGQIEDQGFEVRVINASNVLPLLEHLGPPLSAFTALKDDGESLVASLERWFCNRRSDHLARWNVAMTKG